jgi:hypothetical protein
MLRVSSYLHLGPSKCEAGGGSQGADTSSGRLRPGCLVYIAICGVRTSHVPPTHGQVSAPSSLRWCDGRRKSGMAFKRNLRAIIFKSRPLPPPPSLFTRQLMQFHLSLIVVYEAVLSISGTNPPHAGLHTDRRPPQRRKILLDIKQRSTAVSTSLDTSTFDRTSGDCGGCRE